MDNIVLKLEENEENVSKDNSTEYDESLQGNIIPKMEITDSVIYFIIYIN